MKGSITMKKVITVLLVLSIIICGIGSAMAEDFSVRNGVKFGMTEEEVLKIEIENGTTHYESKDLGTKFHYLDCFQLSIAGFDKSGIWYIFNKKTNKLDDIEYFFLNTSVFSELADMLREKYGEPLNSSFTNGKVWESPSYRMSCAVKYPQKLQYYEWIVPFDDCYTLIDVMYYVEYEYGIVLDPHLFITYKYLEKSEVEKLINQQEEEKDRDL